MLRRQQLQGVLVWAVVIVFVVALDARGSDISSFVAAGEVVFSDTLQKSLATDTGVDSPVPVFAPTFGRGTRLEPSMGVKRDGLFLRQGKTGPPIE